MDIYSTYTIYIVDIYYLQEQVFVLSSKTKSSVPTTVVANCYAATPLVK